MRPFFTFDLATLSQCINCQREISTEKSNKCFYLSLLPNQSNHFCLISFGKVYHLQQIGDAYFAKKIAMMK